MKFKREGISGGKKSRKKNIPGDDGWEWDRHRGGIGEQQKK